MGETRLADFSHWNDPDLAKFVEQGFKGFIFKATDGAMAVDAKYAGYVAEATKLGVPYGAYHYYIVAHDAVLQARHFHDFGVGTQILPAIDVERYANVNRYGQASFSNRLRDMVEATASLFGRTPMIYTSQGAWEQLIGAYGDWASSYPLWVANYDTVSPALPSPWISWVLWQYTSSYTLPGSLYKYDADILNSAHTINDLIDIPMTLEQRVETLEAQIKSLNISNNRQNKRIKALEGQTHTHEGT